MADVDAVNERLNGLVTLLQAVGVGTGISKDEMDRAGHALGKSGGADMGFPDARQLNDEQVEALIRKLQQAQAEAPQIIAALEAHAEARSLTGGQGGGGGQGRQLAQQQMQQQQQQQHHQQEEEDDDDDDDYDEDGNYPMVGHGCSDDISVVSDLTTPTVLAGVPVPEEEHYRETLPPMMVGGGAHGDLPPMMIQPPKRKNLVNQVARSGPGAAAPPPRRAAPLAAPQPRGGAAQHAGGAAAARRKNYQSTMAKLHENPHGGGAQAAPPSKSRVRSGSSVGSEEKHGRAAKAAPPSSGDGVGAKSVSKAAPGAKAPPKKRVAKKPADKEINNFNDMASASKSNNLDNWGFDPQPASPKKTTNVDNDGFLVSGFDPFAGLNDNAAANPFRSSAGDLAFTPTVDPFDAFAADGKVKKPSSARPKKPDRTGSSTGTRKAGAGTATGSGQKKTKGRRASTSN